MDTNLELKRQRNTENCKKYRHTEAGRLAFLATNLRSVIKQAMTALEKLEETRTELREQRE